MKKSIILLLILISVGSYAQTSFQITCNPFLQNMQSNAVTVFWEVNKTAKSWIEMGTNSVLGTKVTHSEDGLIDVGNGIQKVKLENLKAGEKYFYRVCSKEITTLQGYKVIYGDSVFSQMYSFTMPPKPVEAFSFLVFNDLHNNASFVGNVTNSHPEFSFAVFNGDIPTDINDETNFCKYIFSPLSTAFATQKPIVMVRGNHETRGAASRNLYKYFDTPTGKYYYSYTWGNTFFLILDCGEDKQDANREYFGLADYDKYRSTEAVWLQEVVKSKEFKQAKFKVVCIHMPIAQKSIGAVADDHGTNDCGKKFLPILNKAGVDLILSGHTHTYRIIQKEKGFSTCPIVIGGAPYSAKSPDKTTYTKVEVSSKSLVARLMNLSGKEIDKVEITK